VGYFQRWGLSPEFDARIKSIMKNIQDIKNANKLVRYTEKPKSETIPFISQTSKKSEINNVDDSVLDDFIENLNKICGSIS
jgi:hypothetical protein